MHAFVAGSTGVLGRRIVSELVERGHDVVGLVRDEAGEARVRERGATPRYGDVLDRDSLVAATTDTDVVINAATAIPTAGRPSRADWERNDRVRETGTANLLAAARTNDVDRFVLQSVVWVARQPDGSRFDERSEPRPDRTTRSALVAERRLEAAGIEGTLSTCTLRGGWFYAHDAAHTERFGRGLLARRLPVVGGGLLGRRDATLSYLHVDDAADAFVVAAEGEETGTFHVVDDRPAPFAAFLRRFAERLGAPPPRRIPGWLARRFVGADSVRLLTRDMPTTNERFREAFDWEPELSSFEAGIDRVVDRWLETETIRPTGDGYEWVEGG